MEWTAAMKAFRSQCNPDTLILRPQEDIDCEVLERLESTLNNACVTEVEKNFGWDETTLVITARRVQPDFFPDFFPADWEATPPEPVFINGVAT